MQRPSAALILVISLLVAGPAIAEPFEDATKAYYRGDYETAYRLIKPLAEQGLPEAQFNLGLMYDKGQGVPQDYAEAVKWYRKAAEQGNAKAVKSYRKAAEQGNAEAQFNLGLMYDKRQGVPQNYAEAAKWYRRAAEQGFAEAQTNLGIMYFTGQGVPKDYVLAHMWFHLATSRYPASEKAKRERAEVSRDIAASKMTPAQIAEAQRLALEWKPN
jgi:TPR repeat protein